PVKFLDPGGLARIVEGLHAGQRPHAAWRSGKGLESRRRRRGDALDKGVPRVAMRTLTLPLAALASALATGICRSYFRHALSVVECAMRYCEESCASRRTQALRLASILREFVGMDYRGSQLADDDARGLIGDAHGAAYIRVRADQNAQRRDHRVARPGDVIDFARLRGNVLRARIGIQRHASSERVIRSASNPSSVRSVCALVARSASEYQRPT